MLGGKHIRDLDPYLGTTEFRKHIHNQVVKKLNAITADSSPIINLDSVINLDIVSLDDLLYSAIDEQGRTRESTLQMIACFDPIFFKKVWYKFEQELTLSIITEACQGGELAGASIFWMAASSIELLRLIWGKFKYELKAEHFLVAPQKGKFQGHTLIWRLIDILSRKSVFHRGYFETTCEILNDITDLVKENELLKGTLCHHDKASFEKMLALLPNNQELKATISLITSRNQFHFQLIYVSSLLKNKKCLEEGDMSRLLILAEKATALGYINAYYELAKILLDAYPALAIYALERVHPYSRYYHQIGDDFKIVARTLLNKNIFEKNFDNIDLAIRCFFEVRGNDRYHLMRDIADQYLLLHNFVSSVSEMEALLPTPLIDNMFENPTIQNANRLLEKVLTRKKNLMEPSKSSSMELDYCYQLFLSGKYPEAKPSHSEEPSSSSASLQTLFATMSLDNRPV